MEKIKAITVLQPWATLWASDLKQYETRGWETLIRGRFAIHAGQEAQFNFTPEQTTALRQAFGLSEGIDLTEYIKGLPRGAVIAVADLVDCYKIARWSDGFGLEGRLLKNKDGSLQRDEHGRRIPWKDRPLPGYEEILFGDFRESRFAWEKTNTIMLPEPLPYRGNQRLWDIPDEIIEKALQGSAQ